MSFPVYQSYRESGVEWIGSIPTDWEVQTIKRTSYLKGRVGWKGLTSDEYLEEGYAYLVTGSDFRSKFVRWDECHCVEQARYDDDPFIQLMNGDLLITKDGTIGKLAIVSGLKRPACLNSGIFLVRPTVPADEVRRLKAEGVRPADIARQLKIGRGSVYRALQGAE